MFWMLLVYVVTSAGYQSPPAMSPSFHAATYPTKEDCEAAAHTVIPIATPDMDDVSKVRLFMVCAPVNPPPPPPVKAAEQPAPVQQPGFLLYPAAPPPPKRTGHKH
ncbi:MAG TPA: hypothetical protein VG309_07735 [Rhizomicrobium sp.]|jgi:hypothetical protein|nr:hypothetical protein [Rhizomicrobium sp.]